jgi:hypothetical protein
MFYGISIISLMVIIRDETRYGQGFTLSELGTILILLVIGGTVFARLFALRRWAAVATSLFIIWSAVASLSSGIWQWTTFWSVLTVAYAVLFACCNRAVLRFGF